MEGNNKTMIHLELWLKGISSFKVRLFYLKFNRALLWGNQHKEEGASGLCYC